ncbi:GtrA family protein [candidate division KSB1 bacterium]|nr:GtrA family protein [candidate division KSB1 bacterium]
MTKKEKTADTPGIFIGRLIRFLKFGTASTTGTLVNTGVLLLLRGLFKIPVTIASPIALACTIFNNFTINDYWTWKNNRRKVKDAYFHRLLKYYISASAGALINYSMLIVLTHGFHVQYLISNLLGSFTGSIFNFCLIEFWAFRVKKDITIGEPLIEPKHPVAAVDEQDVNE